MDHIKEAFQKVKEDISSLTQDINSLQLNLTENKEKINEIFKIIKQILEKKDISHKKQPFESDSSFSTNRHIIPTPSTHPSTHNSPLEPLKPQNMPISTGNRGVPTDKQTNRQTDTSTDEQAKKLLLKGKNSIDDAIEVLNSLDSIKKEIRLKFKRLTEQELLVFSQLYQLDEEFGHSDYRTLSHKLNLSESSIRDYIGRLIKKGIPVEKNKINNKTVNLCISKNLKKIATLSTILQLRDL
jgi:biotin operon repressor